MGRMPILFVGHGSPMNAIEDNRFTHSWKRLGEVLPRPKAILSISAHWFTEGIRILDAPKPKMVYDMYGFPQELYQVRYQPAGSPEHARMAKRLIGNKAEMDSSWGLDHGTWSVLCKMYPKADIPVFQLSVNQYASPEEHFRMGRQLQAFREEGVLLFASGNVVHNLAQVRWDMPNEGLPLADEFDAYIKQNIMERNDKNIIQFYQAGKSAEFSVPILDHFAPLLYILGASDAQDEVTVLNDARVLGALSMTGYVFGEKTYQGYQG